MYKVTFCFMSAALLLVVLSLELVAVAALRHDGGSPANAVLGIGSLRYGNRKEHV
ncbi:hypothetical protein DPMN_104909 [Dreissena polymorpha]|uniref:Uncharacterized protein n=1 Tax=Dreissena polymorpha TaxID=45954 RepID=A0A9D4H8M0_DREPO|nr:hypothetical protein DPMN_104909 [Dreissena polymorpha]